MPTIAYTRVPPVPSRVLQIQENADKLQMGEISVRARCHLRTRLPEPEIGLITLPSPFPRP